VVAQPLNELATDERPVVGSQDNNHAGTSIVARGDEAKPSAPSSSKIAGLKDRTSNTPVSKMRADLNSMLELLKNGEAAPSKKHAPTTNEPAPF